MMIPRRFLALTIGATTALAVGPAFAQQAGYASNHFNPSERGSQWFVLDSLDMRGNGRLALGLVNDYSYRSLVGYERDGDAQGSVVRNQYFAHLGGSVLFADRFRLALNVPLQVYGDGNPAIINGVLHQPAKDTAVGDVRLSADVRIFGEKGDAATMAAGGELFLPAGSTAAYTGDGKPRVIPRVLFAGESGMLVYAARLGYQIRERNEPWGNGYIGSSVVYGASIGAQLANKKLVVGPELFGSTVTADSRAFEKRTTPLELLLGLHYDVGENIRVGAGAGAALLRGYGAPVARGLLSLEWVPGNPKVEAEAAEKVADRDNDGVPDCEDACGWAAGPRSDDPAKNGCPPPDADRDGVADDVDACPLVPGVPTADSKSNGCPLDSDADGVPDSEDACPKESGKRSLDPKLNGCPDRDQDGDGINDSEDACPTAAGVKTADPKTNGCPDPDRDKDGVPNDVDACPDAAGKPDADPKKNGCPMAFLEKGTIKITEQVRFKTASAEIAAGKESQQVLEAVLAVLKAHPEIAKLRVEGHTDNRGGAANNKALSKARAESVAKWLADHGIEKGRLTAQGFGEEKPLESNTTEAGRTANRRVEFHVEQGQAGGNGQ